jgi:hypothetical protein
MQLAVVAGESFDRRDALTCGRADGQRAGARRRTIEMHGAGPALADAAPVLGADQSEVIPQHPQERRGFVHALDHVLFVVHL